MTTTHTAGTQSAGTRDDAEGHLRALVGRDDAALRDDQWAAIEALVVDQRRVARRAAHRLGQVGGLLRRHRAAARPGRRADRDRLAAAGADAQPDRGRRARRHPRGHDQLHQHRGVGADPATRSPPARSTCCWSAPSGSTTPTSATRCCPSWPRPPGCSSSTRRTASPTGATTSAPTTAGSARCSPTCPHGIPVLATTATANARVTADVAEQLGHRGPAPTSSSCAARSTASPCASACSGSRRPSTGWPGSAEHLAELPRLRHHLHASPSPPPRRSPPTCVARPRRAAYSGQTEPPSGSPSSRTCCRAGQGAGRHLRARHGLRQPASASWSTSARRRRRSPTTSRSAAPVAAPTAAEVVLLPAQRGPRHLALLRLPRLPAARSTSARRCARWPRTARRCRTAALETRVDLSRTRLETMLKVLDVDGAVRRVRGGWESHRRRSGPTTTSATPGSRGRATRRAAGDARRTSPPPAAGWSSCASSSTTPAPTACGRCDNCGGLDPRRRGLRRPPSTRPAHGSRRPGVVVEPRKMWPTALANLGIDLKGKITESAEEGRAVGRLTDLGHGQALRELFRPETDDGPVPRAAGRRRARGARRLAPGVARPPDRVVYVESARRPQLTARPRRGPRPLPQAARRRPLAHRRPRRPARAGRGQLRPAGRRGRPPVRPRRSTSPSTAARSCSSTTWSRPAGPSPSPPAPCAPPGRRPCCR